MDPKEVHTPETLTDYTEIEQKIRRSRFFNDRTWSWSRHGAFIGFIIGSVLVGGFGIVQMVRSWQGNSGAALLSFFWVDLLLWVVLACIFFPLLFASAGILLAALRPVFIALFCSVERFEREYGGVGERSRGR